MDNTRILVIPDLHFPYCHPDSLDFLYKLKKLLNPTRVICLGDELDYHAMSFHDSDVDLDSAGTELLKSLGYIDTLHEIFPKMDLMDSNHGSMAYRKAKHHGMPRHLLKSYNEVLCVPVEDWKWHDRLIISLPSGENVVFGHYFGADVLRASQAMGMSVIQGHAHSSFEVRYWQNHTGLHFGATVGCLIDDKSMAFAYNKLQIKRPIMGAMLIENSIPQLIPMVVDSENRWVGTRV